MSIPRFPNGLLSIYRGQLTLSNFQMAASKPSKLDPLFRHEFFTIFTVVKILAKFETRRKIIKASLLWNCLPYPLLKNEKKLQDFVSKIKNVYRNTLILRNLPCPVKILIAHLCIVFTPDKQTDFHVMSTLYQVGSCCISRTYPI